MLLLEKIGEEAEVEGASSGRSELCFENLSSLLDLMESHINKMYFDKVWLPFEEVSSALLTVNITDIKRLEQVNLRAVLDGAIEHDEVIFSKGIWEKRLIIKAVQRIQKHIRAYLKKR